MAVTTVVCYHGLYPCCAKGLEEPCDKVCADCVANTVTYMLRVAYAPSLSNDEVNETIRRLLRH
jgi:hypothetical protein